MGGEAQAATGRLGKTTSAKAFFDRRRILFHLEQSLSADPMKGVSWVAKRKPQQPSWQNHLC
jgi:hypothetical protein